MINIDVVGDEVATSVLSVGASGTSTLDNGACSDVGADCGATSGPANPVTWAAVDGLYTATAILTLDCSDVEAVTVTATHNADSTPVATVYCVPSLSDEDVEIEKQSDDNDSYTFDWDADNGNCLVIADDGTIEFDNDGSFDLEDNDEAEFYCESGVDLTIDERDDHDFVAIDHCENDDGVDVHGSSAVFDINDLDSTAFCTWINDEDFHVTPTVVIGPPTSVSIILTSAAIDCGRSTLVQVIPRSASGGPTSAGTTLVMTSSLGGTFQPSSTIVNLFPVSLANFLYTAPADVSGTTTITARAGNVQTTASVQIVCEVVTPTTTAAPLRPPSAGDGGLLNSSGTNYLPVALTIAAAAAVLALTAASRRFAFATADAESATTPEAMTNSGNPGGFALLVSFVMLAIALLAWRWR